MGGHRGQALKNQLSREKCGTNDVNLLNFHFFKKIMQALVQSDESRLLA